MPAAPPSAPSHANQDADYAWAEQELEKALETDAVVRNLYGEEFQNLTAMLPKIISLRKLNHLNLSGTQVSNIENLFESITLTQPDLSDKQMRNISRFA